MTEKQNKIEAIQLEALEAVDYFTVERKARAGPCPPPPDRKPHSLWSGGGSQSGSGSFAKNTTRILMKIQLKYS